MKNNRKKEMISVAEALYQIGFARNKILATMDDIYGETPEWQRARCRLLTILGEHGLAGRVKRLGNPPGEERYATNNVEVIKVKE